MRRALFACLGSLASILIGVAAGSARAEDRLSTPASSSIAVIAPYVSRIGDALPPPAREALARISGDGRKLLAARSYLRAGPDLAARWSWSDDRIALYRDSDEARAARAEVEGVRARFAEQNPGFELSVRSEVRSLDEQIAKWNESASVARAADVLVRDAVAEFARAPVVGSANAAEVARFARWLESWRPAASPTLAAPGLSAHGRGRAFDFQIREGTRIVAAADSSQIERVWDGEGWTERLAAAVAKTEHFRGPLESPREPWHYDYAP